MPTHDISELVLTRGRPGITQLTAWLHDNVGTHYPVRCEEPRVKVGLGWEIRTEHHSHPEGTATSWILDITDERAYTLYALTWA